MIDSGTRPPTINSAVSALRFFFSIALDRPEAIKLLTFVAQPRKIPVVLSPEEMAVCGAGARAEVYRSKAKIRRSWRW